MERAVIVVNWNGWRDTIECLESVFRLAIPSFRIVVCDNGSTDGSVEKIKSWARGELLAGCANPQLSHLVSPPIPKPIPFCEMTRSEAESGVGNYEPPLAIIQTGDDLGFAGGNNVGLRFALGDPECQSFWIVNNDVVVQNDALSAMISTVQRDPAIGLCGSLNVSYYRPNEVQMQGGLRYNKWTGRLHSQPPRTIKEAHAHPEQIDYPNGASMLVTRSFVEQIGFLEESYLIYFEELDWVYRAKGKFKVGYAPNSVIYHKEGATLGSSTNRRKRSSLAEKYNARNRIVFTKRFVPWALPIVVIAVCLAAFQRFFAGDAKRAILMLHWAYKGIIGDLRNAW